VEGRRGIYSNIQLNYGSINFSCKKNFDEKDEGTTRDFSFWLFVVICDASHQQVFVPSLKVPQASSIYIYILIFLASKTQDNIQARLEEIAAKGLPFAPYTDHQFDSVFATLCPVVQPIADLKRLVSDSFFSSPSASLRVLCRCKLAFPNATQDFW
jgi:hypothetical protein